MLNQLNQIKSVLDNTGTLNKANREYITSCYVELFGRKPLTKTNCGSCWKDALIELIVKLSPKKIRMRYGCVERYEGIPYNHKNITDEIALKIMEENPNSKTSFYGL